MKPCPLTGAGHHWRLTPYEKYISRAACACGAVNFMADTFGGDPEFRQWMESRLKQLNKTEGKEENMVAQINATELKPETLEKLGIKTQKPLTPYDVKSGLSPVPPRPDLTGVTHGNIGRVMKKYYEANSTAILADRENIGDKEARWRWGFSNCGYKNFLKRRGLTYIGGGYSKRVVKKVAAPAVPQKEKVSNTVKREAEEALKKAAEAIKPKEDPPAAEKVGPEKPQEAPKTDPSATNITYQVIIIEKRIKEFPALPAFKWYWWPGVQKRWFEAYEKLAGKA
jgi:hypothetical protein